MQFGLVGYPLGHSFSKKYFTEKFKKENIAGEYLNFEIQDLSALKGLLGKHPDLRGFNVTIPYKQTILPLLDKVEGAAREIGAVNCVKIQKDNGRIYLTGYNTDAEGFRASLQPFLTDTVSRALVLGSGGAARAVHYALQQLGIASLTVSRTPQPAKEIGYADVVRYLPEYRLLVNATPLGTWPNTETCPPLPYERLTARHYLFDLVYNPEITLFMKRGLEAGAHVLNGFGMLVAQAEAAWEIWNRKETAENS